VVGRVRSAPLGAITQHVLETSDNEAAEVLLRHVALAQGLPGSFAAGVRATRAVLERLGVRFPGARWYDGSGLSRRNRLAVATLIDVLVVALGRPRLATVTAGLPVAGFNGSLSDRFDVASDPGLGRVRAKTGTLTGVSGMAGVIRTREGGAMLYAAVADRVRETDTLWARARLDRISAALASCRCGVR
jgi:serine-type D-Ala-D-Ala carboxypeptidase/endopeptidase (penicillin-binding protein 4)